MKHEVSPEYQLTEIPGKGEFLGSAIFPMDGGRRLRVPSRLLMTITNE